MADTAATGTTRVDMTTPDLQPKVIHAGDNWVGQPYIVVTEEGIVINGDLNTGVVVSPDFGVGLVGPVALTTTPDQISVGGGYWRVNPMVLACMGSSAAMPIPWLIPGTPALLASSGDMNSLSHQAESYL